MKGVQVYDGSGEKAGVSPPPAVVAPRFVIGLINAQGNEYNTRVFPTVAEAIGDMMDLFMDNVPEGANGLVAFYRLRKRVLGIVAISQRTFRISGKAADGSRVFVRRCYA